MSRPSASWMLLTATAIGLAACAPVERPQAASSVPLPESFALQGPRPDTTTTTALSSLLPVTDPGFVALRDQALAQAPDLAVAAARVDAARAGLRGARAARLPDVSASGGASRERISAAQFGALPPNIQIQQYQSSFNAAVDASWDLDLFGRLRASQRASAARLDAATADAAAVRLALVTDIAAAVTDFREIEQRRLVIGDDRDSAQQLARLTTERVRAGLAPASDAVRARSLEEQAAARLDAIDGERAEVIGRLVTLTGLPADAVLSKLAQPVPTEDAAAQPVAAIATAALRSRPDVVAAERRLAVADAEIAAAAAERFPSFSLTAGLGLISLALGDLLTQDAIIGSLGGAISGPLLDFGRVGARIDQREAEGREAFANYRKTLFTALGETEAALGGLDAARRNAQGLLRQSELDRAAAEIARERYRLGLSTFLTVLEAERVRLASAEAAVSALASARRQGIALYRAAGGADAAP
ncbi:MULTISPECIES: efflux transporter outer membrane subunit [unclassified Blastomonas]|uniref:efflux transporter outer membrane subunit n=3 Tax=Sphingomonadales TaxID=204457 RepID=UPI0009E721FE|nr:MULTISPECIES: efflux transporter outer membrane subunit [unclassified Blastomonas]